MKLHKSFAFVMTLLMVPAVGAEATQYTKSNLEEIKEGESVIAIQELGGATTSRREVYQPDAGYKCHVTSFTGNCDYTKKGADLYSEVILGACEAEKDPNCVEEFGYFDTLGQYVKGNFIGYVGGEEVPSSGKLIAGRNASLWELPGLPNDSENSTYMLAFEVRQQYWNGEIHSTGVNATIVPYGAILEGDYQPERTYEAKNTAGKQTLFGGHPDSCVWTDTGICAVYADFVGEPNFSLQVRMPNEIQGWFRGRVKNPTIDFEKLNSMTGRLSITGQPAAVPRFAVFANRENTPLDVQEMFPIGSGGSGGDLFTTGSVKGFFATDAYFSESPYRVLEAFREEVNDTADSITNLWSFSTIDAVRYSSCFDKQGVLGVVSTNATVYDGSTPKLESGFLTYRVAGMHYQPGGQSVNLGTYDLIMRSDVARCMFGYSNAPISATVQVLGGEQERVATTIVSEKDGWLKLAAYGFTFSEKEIKVRLTQPYSKTLTKFAGSTKILTSRQRAEIRATVAKAKNNPKFICTGTYVAASSKSTALARAKATCNYAKSIDKNHSYFAQAKQTSAKSYDAKVMITSK